MLLEKRIYLKWGLVILAVVIGLIIFATIARAEEVEYPNIEEFKIIAQLLEDKGTEKLPGVIGFDIRGIYKEGVLTLMVGKGNRGLGCGYIYEVNNIVVSAYMVLWEYESKSFILIDYTTRQENPRINEAFVKEFSQQWLELYTLIKEKAIEVIYKGKN